VGKSQGVRRDGSIADRSGRLSEFVRRWVFAGAPVVLPVGGARPRRLMARVRPPAWNSPVSAPQQTGRPVVCTIDSIDKASADLVRMPAIVGVEKRDTLSFRFRDPYLRAKLGVAGSPVRHDRLPLSLSPVGHRMVRHYSSSSSCSARPYNFAGSLRRGNSDGMGAHLIAIGPPDLVMTRPLQTRPRESIAM